jgi:drug/metabolite transporter (DMT)-like permease
MLAGGLLIVVNDSANKWLVADYPVGEVLFLRGVFIAPLVIFLARRHVEFQGLRSLALNIQVVRAVLVAGMNFFFVAALSVMPLAETIALTFASPLFIALLAPPILGEAMDSRRWGAVGMGFLGVLLIAQPGGEAFRFAALLPLAAALCGALKDVITRRISRTEKSLTTLFFSTTLTTLLALVTAPYGWHLPSPGDGVLFVTAGLLMAAAHYLFIEALRFAEATLVAPLIFIELVWSVILGYLIWGNVPDARVFWGALIIVCSGIIVIRRKPVV